MYARGSPQVSLGNYRNHSGRILRFVVGKTETLLCCCNMEVILFQFCVGLATLCVVSLRTGVSLVAYNVVVKFQ